MNNSLVYSSTGITSLDGVVNLNHHTDIIYVMNRDKDDDVTIKLNNKFLIILPHVPNGAIHHYHQIPGDYTTIEVLTANATVAFYAVG